MKLGGKYNNPSLFPTFSCGLFHLLHWGLLQQCFLLLFHQLQYF
ncbi:hypothetical protein HanXRQr2_Chr17g0779061 [Helianthus annuus]|uniref:Uncharacterized protein n=1 Tax=Helianthus annuus TaxID=4232 RepID=A0A9K3GRJ9_HELAN|nr:hypothetical protein HanXRQr2_Chr17g0779061 [Helianthus annuus]KAJ0811145.1 hypothetical protein HanPSC8_Chr17g0747481 [Helianthus annuus]